jgi:hypothetical protein
LHCCPAGGVLLAASTRCGGSGHEVAAAGESPALSAQAAPDDVYLSGADSTVPARAGQYGVTRDPVQALPDGRIR